MRGIIEAMPLSYTIIVCEDEEAALFLLDNEAHPHMQ